jgi:hypothetical protein
MQVKSGKAVKIIKPAKPAAVEPADEADPGKVEELKAKQRETSSGKYGKTPVPAFKPSKDDSDEDEEKKAWIEIEMVDEDDEPVAGVRYKIELPDGSVSEGSLDSNGFARVDGIEPGNCKVSFPELDKSAWEKA